MTEWAHYEGPYAEALYLKELVSVARAAGEVLSKHFRVRGMPHSLKAGRANVVTAADLESQRLITKELSRLFPDIPVVGEESDAVNLPKTASYFLVDPLDGTLNFLQGLPFFSVSIAFMQGGQPLAGVVHAPALGETFYAARGAGAFFNGSRLAGKEEKALKECVAVTGWPYDPSLLTWAQSALCLMQKEVREVRILGACSLEMCYVAAGFIDVYWEIGLSPWDVAAGWVIINESGGVVTDLDGSDFDPFSGRVLASRSAALHREAVRVLSRLLGDI